MNNRQGESITTYKKSARRASYLATNITHILTEGELPANY